MISISAKVGDRVRVTSFPEDDDPGVSVPFETTISLIDHIIPERLGDSQLQVLLPDGSEWWVNGDQVEEISK